MRLFVVGDGPYRNEMAEALKDLPVVFTGYIQGEELSGVFASADLFVFPSTTDTFGNVILEAQASGVPVLVTDQGGPQENMIPGETGIVVHGEDEDAFFKGILKMLNDRESLMTMGAAARVYAEKRSFKGIFKESWEFYKQAENNSSGCFGKETDFHQGQFAVTAFGALRWL